jgi:hypothetical protein
MAEKKKMTRNQVEKKEPSPPKPKNPLRKFEGDILRGQYDEEFLTHTGLLGHTRKRKVRYWCFKIRNAYINEKPMPDYPKGLKEFIEDLPGFAGWEYFAVTWDVEGHNPFKIVLRLQRVWEEWEQVMNRVAIPINTPPEQISARIQALTDEYARKEAKKR